MLTLHCVTPNSLMDPQVLRVKRDVSWTQLMAIFRERLGMKRVRAVYRLAATYKQRIIRVEDIVQDDHLLVKPDEDKMTKEQMKELMFQYERGLKRHLAKMVGETRIRYSLTVSG
jgi:hypothetical protein